MTSACTSGGMGGRLALRMALKVNDCWLMLAPLRLMRAMLSICPRLVIRRLMVILPGMISPRCSSQRLHTLFLLPAGRHGQYPAGSKETRYFLPAELIWQMPSLPFRRRLHRRCSALQSTRKAAGHLFCGRYRYSRHLRGQDFGPCPRIPEALSLHHGGLPVPSRKKLPGPSSSVFRRCQILLQETSVLIYFFVSY